MISPFLIMISPLVIEERFDLLWAAHLFRSLAHSLNSRSSARTDYFHFIKIHVLVFIYVCFEHFFAETADADIFSERYRTMTYALHL